MQVVNKTANLIVIGPGRRRDRLTRKRQTRDGRKD